MNITTLVVELGSDPSGYGYAGMTDAEAAAALNLVRDGSVGAAIRVRRTDISGQELLEAIDLRDLTTPPGTVAAYNAAYLESVLQQPRVAIGLPDGSGDNLIKDNLDLLVGNVNGSQTRLNQLRFRFISRAELLGLGVVQPGHVAEARALNG
jgi:hypothetical protein